MESSVLRQKGILLLPLVIDLPLASIGQSDSSSILLPTVQAKVFFFLLIRPQDPVS